MRIRLLLARAPILARRWSAWAICRSIVARFRFTSAWAAAGTSVSLSATDGQFTVRTASPVLERALGDSEAAGSPVALGSSDGAGSSEALGDSDGDSEGAAAGLSPFCPASGAPVLTAVLTRL